ncbi:MAG: hypothetical protein WDM90_23995 [Ferruginibacter sp.]
MKIKTANLKNQRLTQLPVNCNKTIPMNKISSLVTLLGIIIFASCNQKTAIDTEDGLATFSADSMKAHIAILASDSFMGRKPFTLGETRTLDYLQKQFAAAGLEPGNGSSYLQDVPMVNLRATAAPSMQVQTPKGNFDLKAFDDYIIWTDKPDSSVVIDKADLVFAGYGVVAPEYNWNDYAGLDVKGKIVMVMVNDPAFGVAIPLYLKEKR